MDQVEHALALLTETQLLITEPWPHVVWSYDVLPHDLLVNVAVGNDNNVNE